jgi:hypothetical protein
MYESNGFKPLDSLEKFKIGGEVVRFVELVTGTTIPTQKIDTTS